MPSLKMNVPHQLGQEEATKRLDRFMTKLKNRYQDQVSNLQETWVGNLLNFAFTTYGFNIKGNMAVEENEIKLDGQIPFAAMMFKGKIETTIREELNKLLA